MIEERKGRRGDGMEKGKGRRRTLEVVKGKGILREETEEGRKVKKKTGREGLEH